MNDETLFCKSMHGVVVGDRLWLLCGINVKHTVVFLEDKKGASTAAQFKYIF